MAEMVTDSHLVPRFSFPWPWEQSVEFSLLLGARRPETQDSYGVLGRLGWTIARIPGKDRSPFASPCCVATPLTVHLRLPGSRTQGPEDSNVQVS